MFIVTKNIIWSKTNMDCLHMLSYLWNYLDNVLYGKNQHCQNTRSLIVEGVPIREDVFSVFYGDMHWEWLGEMWVWLSVSYLCRNTKIEWHIERRFLNSMS